MKIFIHFYLCNFSSAKMNLLKSKTESNWHPYGCVKLDLSELWLGQTSLEFYIPVVPCHAPESLTSRFSLFAILVVENFSQDEESMPND